MDQWNAFSPYTGVSQGFSLAPNTKAFLDFLSKAEGADYNTIVGGGTFDDFSQHPNIVGLRTAEGPSTAAGRYQIVGTTYRDVAPKLGITDFSPESQDKIAIELIRKAGALEDVQKGDYQSAISKLGNVWASLPSSPYSQPKKSQDWVNQTLEAITNTVIPEAQAQGVEMKDQADPWAQFKPYQEVPQQAQQPQNNEQDAWAEFTPFQQQGAQTVAPPQGQQFSNTVPQVPVGTARRITDEGFNTDPTWINNAKKVYSEVEGQPFKGSEAEAADWLKNYVAQTNWSLAGAGTTIYDVVNKFSPEGKQALLQSIQDYEKAPTSMESFGRAAKGLILDPANLVGLGLGTAATKVLGKKALSQGLQTALRQGLTKATTSPVGSALTGQTARLAAGAGGVSALDEALRQGVQVSAGGKPGLELGDIALAGAGGAALGVGGSKVIDRLTGRSALRQFGARAGSKRQARIDAEIAQDFQDLAKNPNLLTSTTQDAADVTTDLRNELSKRYITKVENAIRIVDPELLKKIDVKNVTSGERVIPSSELDLIRGTPEGDLLADSIEKYQRARALTAPKAASGSLAAITGRAALQYGPRLATSLYGFSSGDIPTGVLGALVPGVSAGTAQRITGKKTVPQVIEQLGSGSGLKAAQQAQEFLGPSGIPQRTKALTQKSRDVQTSQAQAKAQAAAKKAVSAEEIAKKTAERAAKKEADLAAKSQAELKQGIADIQAKDPSYLLGLSSKTGTPRSQTEMSEFSSQIKRQMEAREALNAAPTIDPSQAALKQGLADIQSKDSTYLLGLSNPFGTPRSAKEMTEFSKMLKRDMEKRSNKLVPKNATPAEVEIVKKNSLNNWTEGKTGSGGIQGTMTEYTGLKDKDLIDVLEELVVRKPDFAPFIQNIRESSKVPNTQVLGMIQDEAVRIASENGLQMTPKVIKKAAKDAGIKGTSGVADEFFKRASNVVSSLDDEALQLVVNRTTSASGKEIDKPRSYATGLIAKILNDRAQGRTLDDAAQSLLDTLGL